ncbi:AMP-binding protein [Saccharothrix obliqua]|uniref:AMP-binding protein n=1 Tax=Saccharothrix obliqua TaxID=2861747 RepID=UPI001C5D0837|nr:AMP-binding protein [Saccharothrix obliqua]MBW4721028.1 long-chain fatty acid--CoA ligase [Saccharothrix obliqua]
MREFVTDLLHRHGDDVPAFSSRHTLTHGALRAAVSAEAKLFAAAGVGAGNVVAVRLPPSFTRLEVVLALWVLGARVVVLDHRSPPATRDLEHRLCRPQYVVRASGRFGDVFRERCELVTERRPDGAPATTRHRVVQVAGTRAVGRSTESVIREVVRYSAARGVARRGERQLLLPGFGPVGGLLHALAEGVHLVFPEDDSAAAILRAAARYDVDVVAGLPRHFASLVAEPDRAALRGVRAAYAGGDPLPPEVADGFARTYGLPLGEWFGTTETGVLALDVSGRAATPLGDTVLRVRDGRVEVALDESPYLDEAVGSWSGGWLRTGARGGFDVRGNLRLDHT